MWKGILLSKIMNVIKQLKMEKRKVSVCTSYYNRLLTKKLDNIEYIFSANPTVSSPMDEVLGLEGVVKAAKAFSGSVSQ